MTSDVDDWTTDKAYFNLVIDYYESNSCPSNVSNGVASPELSSKSQKFTADHPKDSTVSACIGLLTLGADVRQR